jgi:hypothetical protein
VSRTSARQKKSAADSPTDPFRDVRHDRVT